METATGAEKGVAARRRRLLVSFSFQFSFILHAFKYRNNNYFAFVYIPLASVRVNFWFSDFLIFWFSVKLIKSAQLRIFSTTTREKWLKALYKYFQTHFQTPNLRVCVFLKISRVFWGKYFTKLHMVYIFFLYNKNVQLAG